MVVPQVALDGVAKKSKHVAGPVFNFHAKGDEYYVARPTADLKSIQIHRIPNAKVPAKGCSCFQEDQCGALEENARAIEARKLPEQLRVVQSAGNAKGYEAFWGYLNLE